MCAKPYKPASMVSAGWMLSQEELLNMACTTGTHNDYFIECWISLTIYEEFKPSLQGRSVMASQYRTVRADNKKKTDDYCCSDFA